MADRTGWFMIYDGGKFVARVIPGMWVRFKMPVELLVDKPIHGGLSCVAHPVPDGAALEYLGQYYWGSDPGPGWPEFRYKNIVGHLCARSYDWGCFKHGEVAVVTPEAKGTK